MNFILIYVSPNGTTRITTEILGGIIEKNGHKVELMDIGSQTNRGNFHAIIERLEHTDIVGFGSPAYHMDMLEPMRCFFDQMIESKGTFHFKAFLYLNYAGITSGKAFLNTAKLFNEMQIPIIGAMKVTSPHFHHKEKFPLGNTEAFIQEFYTKMEEQKYASIVWTELYKKLSYQKLQVNLIYPFVHFLGRMRTLKISINQEKCVKCGKCTKECPVGAISMQTATSIDFIKCIHCYHCIVACKLNAVEARVDKLDKMIRMNKTIIGVENPQNDIYI